MKKSILLYICVLLFLSNSSYGQNFKVEKSVASKKYHKNEWSDIIFPSAYGFMTYSYTDVSFTNYAKGITIKNYDQTMQEAGTYMIDFPSVGYKVASLDKVVETDNKLLIFTNFLSRKLGVHKTYVQSFDRESKSISETAVAAEFPIEKLSKSGQFTIESSQDKSKIVVFANMPFEKKTNEQVKIWVYDQDMNLLWEQSETLDFPSKRAYTEDVFVTNNGEVLVLKTSNPLKNSRKTEILKFDSKSVSVTPFSEEGFHHRDIQMIDFTTKQLFTGFYWTGSRPVINTKKSSGEETDGAFLYDISESKLLGKHAFNKSFGEQNTLDLVSLQILAVELVGNDIYLVGEKQLKESSFKGEGTTRVSTEIEYTYTYGTKLLVNMDMQGTLKDMTRIEAKAIYKDESAVRGSTAVHYIDDGLRLFRNRWYTVGNNYVQPETYYSEKGSNLSNSIAMYLQPHTVRVVPHYNIMYFITESSGQNIKFNKITWE